MRCGSGGVAQATQRENAFGFDSACLGCSVGVGYLGICVSAVGWGVSGGSGGAQPPQRENISDFDSVCLGLGGWGYLGLRAPCV